MSVANTCQGCYFGVCEAIDPVLYKGCPHEPDISGQVICVGCGKPSGEIPSVVEFANEEGLTPDQWVRENDGTYLIKGPNTFYDDECYVAAGMPLNHG